jgi:hypothetical protein
MNEPKLVERVKEKRRLVINQNYIAELRDSEDWHAKLDEDISKIVNGGTVILCPPDETRLMGLYRNIRSYVTGCSIRGNYTIKTRRNHDAEVIKNLLQGHVSGSHSEGYRYQYQPAQK